MNLPLVACCALGVWLIVRAAQLVSPAYLCLANFFLYVGLKTIAADPFPTGHSATRLHVMTALGCFALGLLSARLMTGPAANSVPAPSAMTAPGPRPALGSDARLLHCILGGYAVLALQLQLNGLTILAAMADPIAARWALGNSGNIAIQLAWTNLLLIAGIVSLIERRALLRRVGMVAACVAPFLVLSVRAPIVDLFFAAMVYTVLRRGRMGFHPVATIATLATGGALVAALGLVRVATQLEMPLAELVTMIRENASLIEAGVYLFLERLDYLDVLLAAEPAMRSVTLPPVPFIYGYLPRALFADKIFPTDTQVTQIAGEGYAQDNITRIVGIVAEAMSLNDGIVLIAVWFTGLGLAYHFLGRRLLQLGPAGTLVYARMAPALGALPLFGGLNTIFMQVFLMNLLASAAIVRYLHAPIRHRPSA